MPRRREVPKREILPDPKYQDGTVAKFINVIMRDGKKSIAEKILYGALDIITERGNVGGATYQVPVEVRPTRRNALAMRWLVEGGAARKREETHRMADANKAFSHYRF